MPRRCHRCLPQSGALVRPTGAVLAEAHDERAVADRRYPCEGSMAALATTSTSKEVATPELVTE